MTDIARILIGPLVWLFAFSAVYGLHGIVCGLGWGGDEMLGFPLLRLVLVIAWLIAIGVQVVVLLGVYSRLGSPSDLVREVSRLTAWVGLVATLWSMMPVAVTSSCTI